MGNIIQLGTVSALRNYTLSAQGQGIAWQRGPANPFAAKVSSSGVYDKVDIWNEYVQDDWQTGVGRVDPQAGGYLYGESETRVPNQIILPPLLQQCDLRTIAGTKSDCRYMPAAVGSTVTVGAGGYAQLAMSFTTPATLPTNFFGMYFYGRLGRNVTATISVYTNNAGEPEVVATASACAGNHPDRQFYWYGSNLFQTSEISTATQYWFVIEPLSPSQSFEVAVGTTGYDTAAKQFNGSTWSEVASTYFFYTSNFQRLTEASGSDCGMARFNGALYTHSGENLYKYDSSNEQFDSVGTITGAGRVSSMVVFGPNIYFGRSSGNYTTMNTSESFSAAATTRNLLLEYKGILYGTWQNDLYYTSDGSTWSSAFVVGGDDVEIRGMAGMGDSLYLATDKALMRFAPGDVVEEVSRFGSEDSKNGVGMMEYQGRLYIPSAGRLFRFDPSGQMQDIWISREDDLPADRIGNIVALARMNNWLVVLVVGESAAARPSVWIWQEEGWHYVTSSYLNGFPSYTTSHTLYYDRGTARLWFTVPDLSPMFVEILDYTLNPFNSSTYLYQPYGWLEQDRFYGGQYLLDKDFESVTIVGDNLSTSVHVKVYWQDEGSTGWELLGTVDSDGEELRWSNHATRPQGRWIKLGLLLQTNDSDETPRVRAVVVKNLPMVNDRIRDTVTLTLKNYVEMPDRTLDTYTRAEQLTHIQSMIESVIPIIYQDPLGVQYEVKVVDWNMSATRFDFIAGANVVQEMDVTLVLEQIPDGTYSA